MNAMIWDETLDVKVTTLNEQHKALIDLMCLLESQYKTQERIDLQRTTLDKLYHYALKHFRDEEQLLCDNQVPGLKNHIIIHQKLIARLEEYKRQLNLTRGGLDKEFFIFLQMWIKSHIQGIDAKYSTYLGKP